MSLDELKDLDNEIYQYWQLVRHAKAYKKAQEDFEAILLQEEE